MRAVYVCPKCKNEEMINSIGSSAHFKRKACSKCLSPLHFKEIVKEEDKNA